MGKVLLSVSQRRDAERPDVGRGEENGFGRGERRSERPGGSGFAGGENAVGGKFYVVADGVNVGGLEAGMNETFFVEKIERGRTAASMPRVSSGVSARLGRSWPRSSSASSVTMYRQAEPSIMQRPECRMRRSPGCERAAAARQRAS